MYLCCMMVNVLYTIQGNHLQIATALFTLHVYIKKSILIYQFYWLMAIDLMQCRNIRLSLCAQVCSHHLCTFLIKKYICSWRYKELQLILHVFMSPHRDGPLPPGYNTHSDPVALYHRSRPPRLILSLAHPSYIQRTLASGHQSRPEALSPANREFPEGPKRTLIRYTATRPRPSSGKCHMFVQRQVTSRPVGKRPWCPPSAVTPSQWLWMESESDEQEVRTVFLPYFFFFK